MVASEIIHLAVRRGLLRESSDHGSSLRLAMIGEDRDRLAAGLRPRFRNHGDGRFSLATRTLEPDLVGQERALAERLDAIRRETRAAYRRRLLALSPEALQSYLRVLLEQAGLRDLALQKRLDRLWIYQASRHRARGGSGRALVVVHTSTQDLGRKAVSDARDAARTAGAAEAVLVTLGRAAGDATTETTRGAPPVSVIDAEELLEIAAEHSLGFFRLAAPVQYLDVEFFEGLPG
jgi:hypothetical protein